MAGASLATAFAEGAGPELSDVALSQTDGTVTITYTLANGPAVVTADILTNAVNAAEGVSIGARNLWNLDGDVNRLVTGDGPHTITWKPANSWPGHRVADASVRARLTAWEPTTPPPYMVAALKKKDVRYYASEDALPGGLHENPEYKLTKVVMKRIEAAGQTATLHPQGTAVQKTMDADYYIGIFEVTRGQWAQYGLASQSNGFNIETAFRPMANVSCTQIRYSTLRGDWGLDAGHLYPNAPAWEAPQGDGSYVWNSFLSYCRVNTGVGFDLPTAEQWEYAARGGYGDDCWGDGTKMMTTAVDANLDKLGRYKSNGGEVSEDYPANRGVAQADWTSANGSAVVGSYKPNGYGLYDMHGNVAEWTEGYTELANGTAICDARGGDWKSDATACGASSNKRIHGANMSSGTYGGYENVGFRLAAPCIAK